MIFSTSHAMESAHLTFVSTFTDILYEHYSFLDQSNMTDIPEPKMGWSFIVKCFEQPLTTKKTDFLQHLPPIITIS